MKSFTILPSQTARLAALLTVVVLALAPAVLVAEEWWPSSGEPVLTPRIVNGVSTSDFPSVGLLLSQDGGVCTGTLIGCRTLLTAAHCVQDDPSPGAYLVFLQHQGFSTVASVAVHPDFSGQVGTAHDLAVLRLPAELVGIAPAALHTASSPPFGTEGVMVGFGSRGFDSPAGLKIAGINHTESCAPLSDQHLLCAGLGFPPGPPGQDSMSCQGDSGGPLLIGGAAIAGVASFTAGGGGMCIPPYGAGWANVFADRAWIQGVAGADLGTTACGSLPAAGSAQAPFFHAAGELATGDDGADLPPINVPAGTTGLGITLNGELSADFDLYLRRGGPATSSLNDCSSAGLLNLESCFVADPAPGPWHVRVEKFQGTGRFQATATVFGATPSGVCTPNDTTLCLFGGRFSVNLDFTRPGNPTERARVERREDQWGTFAFFAGSNIPNAMVTIGPRPNGFYAVQVPPLQAAALEVVIFDHQTQTSKRYTKPQGDLELIIDPAAFPQ